MRQRITFVGSGTPDPELLTVRAAAALRTTRAIVADAEAECLATAWMSADTELVLLEVDLSFTQRMRRIKDVLKRHNDIVRCFGGDPVVDGILAQELDALRETAQIAVVPGITSAANAATFAGISLTGRAARELRIVEAADPDVDWSGSARETLVVKGGGTALPSVVERMLEAGRDPATPFRIVCGAGASGQQSTLGTLDGFSSSVSEAQLTADAVLFVGSVVDFGDDWFERLPLAGWRVLVPRTKDPLTDVRLDLERDGAIVTPVSTLSVEPPRTPQQMDKAFSGLAEGRYGWVVFTCASSFAALWTRCLEYGLDARAFAGMSIAAVGEDTIDAMRSAGLRPELMTSEEHTTHALLERFPEARRGDDVVRRVLVPRAEIATETLAAGLTQLGWEVDEITAFRTVRSAPPAPEIRDAIKGGGFEAVVFTSSATVRNLIGLAGKPHARTVVACIGSRTAQAAEEHGLRVDVIAAEPTHEALVEALVAHANATAGAGLSTPASAVRRGTAPRRAK